MDYYEKRTCFSYFENINIYTEFEDSRLKIVTRAHIQKYVLIYKILKKKNSQYVIWQSGSMIN